MSQLDIAALVEAVCGAAGASGVWGVSAAGQCLHCVTHYQSLRCHGCVLVLCSVALVLPGDAGFVLQAGSTSLASAVCLTTVHHTLAESLPRTCMQCSCSFDSPFSEFHGVLNWEWPRKR